MRVPPKCMGRIIQMCSCLQARRFLTVIDHKNQKRAIHACSSSSANAIDRCFLHTVCDLGFDLSFHPIGIQSWPSLMIAGIRFTPVGALMFAFLRWRNMPMPTGDSGGWLQSLAFSCWPAATVG
jgi:hypothetical protein